jgi:3-hydroxyacyl-[acyl-carrier-protein] dehydratase
MSEHAVSLDVREIMRNLPHRYPFLLVDRIVEFESGHRIRAIKNVTINEPFFMGHFENYPVMPGVLIVEALAQAAGVLAILSAGAERKENELYFFVGIDNARFRRQVIPGDQLMLEAVQVHCKRGIGKYKAIARVGDEIACEAEIMCANREV